MYPLVALQNQIDRITKLEELNNRKLKEINYFL